MLGRLVPLAALAAGLSLTSAAVADSMDLALDRFVSNPGQCLQTSTSGEPVPGLWNGQADCAPDNFLFKRLIAQMGYAMAPSGMHSARTTGFGGFHFSLEAQFADIDQTADYWEQGTRGSATSSGEPSIRNGGVSSVLQTYSAKLRKSFGFGLELTGTVGWFAQTTMLHGGADVRLSLLEGFRTKVPGYLPDFSVGGSVRTMTGTPQLHLTVVGFEAHISKDIVVGDASVIVPWIGDQHLWIFGDAGLTDLTARTDQMVRCDDAGAVADPVEGVCWRSSNGVSDRSNTIVFDSARFQRNRLLMGLAYRYEFLWVGGQFALDLMTPEAGAGSDRSSTNFLSDGTSVTLTDKEIVADLPNQWTVAVEVGVYF